MGLSSVTRTAWAKSNRTDRDLWLPVHQHLDDTSDVAGLLFDRWVSRAAKVHLTESFPGGVDDARIALTWLAALHDSGKVSPAFAVQVSHLADRMRTAGFLMREEYDDRRLLRHELAGLHAVKTALIEAGFSSVTAKMFGAIVGAHHGLPPESTQLRVPAERPALYGDGLWHSSRVELMDRAAVRTGAIRRFEAWSDLDLPMPAQITLSALMIMADWIASNDTLFPYDRLDRVGSERTDAQQSARVARGWNRLDLPRPWMPPMPAVNTTTEIANLFAERFGWHDDRCPRPTQVAAVQLVRDSDPGLMIIEEAMGAGKTEAALAAAEVLAARTGATGILIALPTQATTNAMFDRVLPWLEDMPSSAGRVISLAHGKAALNDNFAGLDPGQPLSGIYDDDEDPIGRSIAAHAWMRGNKKTTLANFVICTIDQVLFSGLRAKHAALRHLGLIGKVVVIDEVHAYDPFMSTYLERVLALLGDYRVSVILLSATLPSGRRQELLRAYAGGAAVDLSTAGQYPRITGWSRAGGLVDANIASSPEPDRPVRIQIVDDDLDVVVSELRAALVDGGCAAVVRNTVRRVQETADRLRESLPGVEIIVAHSQFLAFDRLAKDADLLAKFGPPGLSSRPRASVVVASQVIEQSLDVDFDFMITDVAPMDLTLQRLGRLHRHRRGAGESDRPVGLRTAQCVVVGGDVDAVPPRPDRGSCSVYDEYHLLRALGGLTELNSALRVPSDIAPLVERAYSGEAIGPPSWAERMVELRANAQQHAGRQARDAKVYVLRSDGLPDLVGWLAGGVGNVEEDSPKGRAQVRDTDDSLEVIVAPMTFDGLSVIFPPWRTVGEETVDVTAVPDDDLARIISSWTLRLPQQFSRPGRIDAVIEEIETLPRVRRWRWQEQPWIAGQLVLPMLRESALSDVLTTVLQGITIRYDPTRGVEVVDG